MDSHQHRAQEKPRNPDNSVESPKTEQKAKRTPPISTALPPTHWTPPPSDHVGPRWIPSHGCTGPRAHDFSFPAASPSGGGFGGPRYGFDPSIPPPPIGLPPVYLRSTNPDAPVTCGSLPQFRACPQYDFHPVLDSSENRQKEYDDYCEARTPFSGPPPLPPSNHDYRMVGINEAATYRQQDTVWLKRFLQTRNKVTQQQNQNHHNCVPDLKQATYRVAGLLSRLDESCHTLKRSVENGRMWVESYHTALLIRQELQHRVMPLHDGELLNELEAKLSCVGKTRARRLRARSLLRLEKQHGQDHISDREAAIDTWRMKKIQEVEERQREQELKLAADSVLCEVRKKQADVMRMHDVLRSLEKLRRLRKEAASRKGIIIEQDCDKAFIKQLEQLRSVMRRRMVVYSVEEKALMVMLEGEQEEERRREQERRVKKERERQLQRHLMLFGDEPQFDSALQPFRQYYSLAQHSLHALIQIRRDWDVFVVAADNPDGSLVPQNWVLPDPPSDQDWATAMEAVGAD
ncbi:programmed cell death protein 7 [Echeneis naucrates]|uniref:Programmed cell death protein 7-like n=1 Tax=Echeneis naucrates TaxID=173247 RepID=A0A665U5G6_ECHNA|nr:programmed cell death protein 7-like [Echeneis naucrates]